MVMIWLTRMKECDPRLKDMQNVKSRNTVSFLKYNVSLGKRRIRNRKNQKYYLNNYDLV